MANIKITAATNIKIMVATPAFGEMFYTPYVQSVLKLQDALHQRKWSMLHSSIGYALVEDARNYLLTRWFDKSDATHLLFVDADMGFEPQLILDMVEFDRPVTGVIYTKRRIDLMKLARLAAKGEAPQQAIAHAHEFIIRPLRGRQPRQVKGFMEVEGCGTGILLIQRRAVATMLEVLPEINDTNPKLTAQLAVGLDRLIRAFDTINVGGVPLVDDYAFCHRWQTLCEGELWARVDQSVTHIGLHKFASSYIDAGLGKPRVKVTIGAPAGVGRAKSNGKRSIKKAATQPQPRVKVTIGAPTGVGRAKSNGNRSTKKAATQPVNVSPRGGPSKK
jgi:hypothetical protein